MSGPDRTPAATVAQRRPADPGLGSEGMLSPSDWAMISAEAVTTIRADTPVRMPEAAAMQLMQLMQLKTPARRPP